MVNLYPRLNLGRWWDAVYWVPCQHENRVLLVSGITATTEVSISERYLASIAIMNDS